MTFESTMEHAAHVFEAIGAVVLVLGLIWSVVLALRTWAALDGRSGYQALRESFGAALLLSLEIFVAADLIRTVAIAPTVENVLVLGLIVLIRTFLSFSLQVEIDGAPPWRRALRGGVSAVSKTARRYPGSGASGDSEAR